MSNKYQPRLIVLPEDFSGLGVWGECQIDSQTAVCN